MSGRHNDADRVHSLKSDRKRTRLVNLCTLKNSALYLENQYIVHRVLRHTTDRKAAPTNDGHLGYTDTLKKERKLEKLKVLRAPSWQYSPVNPG